MINILEELKKQVLEANLDLVSKGLIKYTWGNASGIDREQGLIVIKPSGVPYEDLKAEDLVVLDLDGKKVEGKMRPSSDSPTHVELYKAFKEIGGVVHTHSTWATIWAQAGRSIPCYGTTQADCFYEDIPCSRNLTDEEIESEYEKNTGLVIVEAFKGVNPKYIPGILCMSHGPFAWGKDAEDAVYNAVVMEQVAEMAYYTEQLNKKQKAISNTLMNKHFLRKHGDNAYYGQ